MLQLQKRGVDSVAVRVFIKLINLCHNHSIEHHESGYGRLEGVLLMSPFLSIPIQIMKLSAQVETFSRP